MKESTVERIVQSFFIAVIAFYMGLTIGGRTSSAKIIDTETISVVERTMGEYEGKQFVVGTKLTLTASGEVIPAKQGDEIIAIRQ